jgi:CheY-like chemotaxis protein
LDQLTDPPRNEVAPPGAPEPRGELVLVVDDHPAVLEAVRLLLECKGYRVLAVAQGSEAVRLCTSQPGEVALVVTDMMMPGMDGVATVRALREVDPGLVFIGISGAVDSARLKEFSSADLVALLPKPFGADEMMEALEQALQQRAAKALPSGSTRPPGAG